MSAPKGWTTSPSSLRMPASPRKRATSPNSSTRRWRLWRSGDTDADGARFADVLRHLRGLASSCEPPIGVGSFDVLYASDAEIVVWYAPLREHQQPGEVTIPAGRLAAAWRALLYGETLDE